MSPEIRNQGSEPGQSPSAKRGVLGSSLARRSGSDPWYLLHPRLLFLDRGLDPPLGIGREAAALARIEIFRGLGQSVPREGGDFLHRVGRLLDVLLHQLQDEIIVPRDQLGTRLI